MQATRLAAGIAVALAAGSAHAAAGFQFSHYSTFAHSAGNGSIALGAEILSFDSTSGNLWVVGAGGIDVLNPLTKTFGFGLTTSGPGSPNSVDTYNGVAAVAIAATDKTLPGTVNFYAAANGTLINSIGVGANPDMLTFNANGTRLLVANEGEPEDYLPGDPDNATDDPEGSISIIERTTASRATVSTPRTVTTPCSPGAPLRTNSRAISRTGRCSACTSRTRSRATRSAGRPTS